MANTYTFGIGLLALSLSACASTPTSMPPQNTVSANIRAHMNADGALPASSDRLTLAIKRYNANESVEPVKMHTSEVSSEE